MAAQTVRGRKQKGRLLQKQVVESFLRAFPALSETDIRSIPTGVPGTDIWLSEAAQKALNRIDDIECKSTERLAIWQALEQMDKRAFTSTHKCLIFKRNRSDIWATIPLKYFIELLKGFNNETKD